MNPSKLAKSVIEKNIQHRASITLIILQNYRRKISLQIPWYPRKKQAVAIGLKKKKNTNAYIILNPPPVTPAAACAIFETKLRTEITKMII